MPVGGNGSDELQASFPRDAGCEATPDEERVQAPQSTFTSEPRHLRQPRSRCRDRPGELRFPIRPRFLDRALGELAGHPVPDELAHLAPSTHRFLFAGGHEPPCIALVVDEPLGPKLGEYRTRDLRPVPLASQSLSHFFFGPHPAAQVAERHRRRRTPRPRRQDGATELGACGCAGREAERFRRLAPDLDARCTDSHAHGGLASTGSSAVMCSIIAAC
jgi:hypothetical protein